MSPFKRIISYVARYKRLALLNLVFNAFTAIFSLFSVVMIIPLLQIIFDQAIAVTLPPNPSVSASFILDFMKYKMAILKKENGAPAALSFVCLVVISIIFLKNFFRYLAMRALSPIRTGVLRDIRNDLFAKLVSLPLSYYQNNKKGDLITRMTDDVRAIESGIISVLEVTVREPLNIILSLTWMITISWKLTLFVFAMLIVTGGIIGKVGKTLKKQSLNAQTVIGKIISIVEESISGLRIVQGFTGEAYKAKQFHETTQELYETNNKINMRYELSSPLTEFLSICVFSAVLWFGGSMVLEKELDAATFIGFIAMFSLLIQPAKSFSSAFYNIRIGLASAQRVFEIIDAPNEIIDSKNPIAKTDFTGKIAFENVHFQYHGTEKIALKNINLEIPKGKIIALVGQSGAGKTTLTDLLPRFYDVQKGVLKIDGIDIRSIYLKDLRGLIGLVSQEPILFNDSIYNNIVFGKENVKKEEVYAAAKVANALDFIEKMDDGFDSLIGDRGSKLSGGERQRLTIARAVLKNPPILILDEATSSLDSESEKLVQEALLNVMKDRTTLVIAHRLSTIQHADEIIVMNEGQIAERGTHDTLMMQKGIYHKLVELQAF